MVKLNLPRLPGRTSPALVPALYWLPVLFFLPLIVGVIAKLYRSKYIFSEYQSVACAGLKALQGAPIYALDLQCPGMRAASFVYIPGVAQVAAFFERLLTEPGFLILYLVFYLAAAAALIYFPLFARKTPGNWRDKLPFAVFLSSSAFMLGNIAVILHGLVLVGALAIEISPWLFIAAVAVAAWVKPTFLTYLMVVLLLDIPLRRRIGLMASGVIIGLLPLGHFILTGGALTQQWYALLSHYVYEVTPGVGFFGWTSLIGLDTAHVGVKLAYLVFAGLITISGLALVKVATEPPRAHLAGSQPRRPAYSAYHERGYLPHRTGPADPGRQKRQSGRARPKCAQEWPRDYPGAVRLCPRRRHDRLGRLQ